MILDDGMGMAIDTESKPPTIEQQIVLLETQLAELKKQIGSLELMGKKERQQLKTRYEKKEVELKKLRAKAQKKT